MLTIFKTFLRIYQDFTKRNDSLSKKYSLVIVWLFLLAYFLSIIIVVIILCSDYPWFPARPITWCFSHFSQSQSLRSCSRAAIVCVLHLIRVDVFLFAPLRGSCSIMSTSLSFLQLMYLMLLLFFLLSVRSSCTMCRAGGSVWLPLQLLMTPKWLMWSDPYSRLYQRDHNSLLANLWIWMVFFAAWWITEAVQWVGESCSMSAAL